MQKYNENANNYNYIQYLEITTNRTILSHNTAANTMQKSVQRARMAALLS